MFRLPSIENSNSSLRFILLLAILLAVPLTAFAASNGRDLLSKASQDYKASSIYTTQSAARFQAQEAAAALTNCSVDASLDSEELEFLRLINEHRRSSGLGPLAISDALTRASAWKSKDMADYDYFSHDDTGAVSRTWVARIRDCGYTYSTSLG